MQKNLPLLIVAVLVYIASAFVSYTIFSKVIPVAQRPTETPKKTIATNDYGAITFDESKPKTETCPLNGKKYSKEQRDWWEKHRPLGVMVENHQEARPQSGLLFADVIYEAVAEGGITRFLAVFHCQDSGFIGPVRSARTYFMDWVSEYGDYPLYAHVGGANCNRETGSGCQNGAKADALGQIDDYGWLGYNDLSEFSLGCPVFCRNESRIGHPVATEHTMYTTAMKLWGVAEKRKLTNVNEDGDLWDVDFIPYTFKDDASLNDRPASQTLHLEMWEGYDAYAIDWTYDRENNIYLRNNGGAQHKDRNTGRQLIAKNIVVLHMQESAANDGYDGNAHRLYGNKGTGKADIFLDGERIQGTWRKKNRTARTEILDNKGKSIEFNRGTIWFEILPLDGVLTVK